MPSSFRPSLRAGGPRTQGVPMPSSFRPSLRAGDPRTQDAEAFLFPPPLRAGGPRTQGFMLTNRQLRRIVMWPVGNG
jgi:hypothetical protein